MTRAFAVLLYTAPPVAEAGARETFPARAEKLVSKSKRINVFILKILRKGNRSMYILYTLMKDYARNNCEIDEKKNNS